MKKYDLTDVSFILQVSLDSINRMENVLATTAFFCSHFETSIFVTEYSSFNDGLLEKLLDSAIKYTFQKGQDPILYRTKQLNRMIQFIKTPYLAVWNADVVISIDQIVAAVELLRNKEADFVFPYEKPILDTSMILRKLFLQDGDIRVLEQNVKKMKEIHASASDAPAFITKVSWRPKDDKQNPLCENQDYNIKRIPGPLFYFPV